MIADQRGTEAFSFLHTFGEAPSVLLQLFERGLNSRHFQTRLRSDTGEIMNTGSSKSLGSRAWRDLYEAALFEVDKTRLPERMAQAEKAVVLRASNKTVSQPLLLLSCSARERLDRISHLPRKSVCSEAASRQSGGTPDSAKLYGLDRRGAYHTTVLAGF